MKKKPQGWKKIIFFLNQWRQKAVWSFSHCPAKHSAYCMLWTKEVLFEHITLLMITGKIAAKRKRIDCMDKFLALDFGAKVQFSNFS